MDNDTVLFDSFDLNEIDCFQVTGFEFNQYPNRAINNYKLATQNLSTVTSADLVDKEVEVQGLIRASTRAEAEAVLLEVRKATRLHSKVLQVVQYGREVQYTATLSASNQEWKANKLMVTLVFYCENPVGVDAQTETLVTGVNFTTSPDSEILTFGGSNVEQLPRITLTLTSISGASGSKTITIGNSDTEVIALITRQWANGNVIEIDCLTKQIFVNGNEVDYAGGVPVFAPDGNTLYYADQFSGRTVALEVEYERRYV